MALILSLVLLVTAVGELSNTGERWGSVGVLVVGPMALVLEAGLLGLTLVATSPARGLPASVRRVARTLVIVATGALLVALACTLRGLFG